MNYINENEPKDPPRSRKKKAGGKANIITVIIAAAVLIGIMAGAGIYLNKSKGKFSADDKAAASFGHTEVKAETDAETETKTEADLSEEYFDIKVENPDINAADLEKAEIEQKLSELTKAGFIPIEQSNKDEITMSFAGDILFDEHYAIMSSMLGRSKGAPDIATAFDAAMLSHMRNADIFIVNNEFPYSDRGEPRPNKKFTFRARPQYASLLKDMGADGVTLANNHVNDYGTEAMLDTFTTLEAINMPYAGAGRNLDEAAKPIYYTNGNVKIAVIAATQIERMSNPDTVGATDTTPGVLRSVSDSELGRLLDAVKKAKAEGCFVAVCIHWGTEGSENVDDWQLRQGKEIAAAGADLIVGNHPHVLERLDYIEDTPIIYSLGNYLFNSKTQDTCLYSVTLSAEDAALKEIRFIPAIQSGCRTFEAEGSEKERILSYMRNLSPAVNIDSDGIISKK